MTVTRNSISLASFTVLLSETLVIDRSAEVPLPSPFSVGFVEQATQRAAATPSDTCLMR